MGRLPQAEVDRLIKETGPILDQYTSSIGDLDIDGIIEAEKQPERNAEAMNQAIRERFGLAPAQEGEEVKED